MKKSIFIFSLFFLSFAVSALEVDENEIQSVNGSLIEFDNYGGPHAVIESAEAITGIGRNLGNDLIRENIQETQRIHEGEKYSVIHAVNEKNNELLNADILIFSEVAGVDHIDNVRRIISGFLRSAYNYSEQDARALSTFITVYNAIYRGQFKNFLDKYKDIVLLNLSEEDSGLSENWEDWAGHTQIVIPLKDITEETVSPIDTGTISDDKVIETLRQTDDKAIEEREQIVDLKDREANEAQKKAQDAQKNAAQQKKEGNKTAAAQSAQNSKTQQQIADRKRNEVQAEKTAIAKDLESLKSSEPEDTQTGLFGADKKGFYRLITVNSQTGKINLKSPVTQIKSKAAFTVQNVNIDGTNYPLMYIAICGENSGKSAVRLCLIDGEKLELKKESSENVSADSDLVPYNDDFLVIIEESKKSYVAKFDKNLNVICKSSLTVTASTPLNLTASGLLVTDSDGNPALLSLSDLTTVWQSGM